MVANPGQCGFFTWPAGPVLSFEQLVSRQELVLLVIFVNDSEYSQSARQ
jgi:hypothetical protein